MPDQVPIPPPPPPSPGPELGPKSTSTGLPSNMAAAIACIPLVGGVVFYILEKHDSFVRFYAMQSIIFGVGWILIHIGCAIVSVLFLHIPVIGWVFGLLWGLVCVLMTFSFLVLV